MRVEDITNRTEFETMVKQEFGRIAYSESKNSYRIIETSDIDLIGTFFGIDTEEDKISLWVVLPESFQKVRAVGIDSWSDVYTLFRMILNEDAGLRYESEGENEKIVSVSDSLKKSPFSFEWKTQNGLKYVSDATFNMAKMAVDLGFIFVEPDLDENGQIVIERDINVADGEKRIITSVNIIQDILLRKPDASFGLKLCVPCGSEIVNMSDDYYCLYVAAGYIDYLQKTGQEALIEEDRRFFKAHYPVIKKVDEREFSFSFPNDLYMQVSSEKWKLAKKLQALNYVAISSDFYKRKEADTSKYVYITWPTELENFGDDIRRLNHRIDEDSIDRKVTSGFDLHPNDIACINKTMAKFGVADYIGLAAYIDYLDKSGNIAAYETALRAKWAAEQAEVQRTLGNIDYEIVDKMIANPDCQSLYCAVEGEDGTGRKAIAIGIAKKLMDMGKIIHFEELDDIMTIEMAANKMFRYEAPSFEGNPTDIVGTENKEGNPMSLEDIRTFLALDGEKLKVYRGYASAERISFKKKRVYILTDLKEYLPRLEDASMDTNTAAGHFLDLLGRYRKDTYIIIVDEKRYIDHLFSLHPQIKYLFSSAIISIDSLSGEELYELYWKGLQKDLQAQVDNDSEYEHRFADFCARNKKNLPMKNRELAEFLANYANIHHDINKMFEDMEIYSTKTADELLAGVIGMASVKNKVEEFKKYALYKKYAENIGMTLPNSNMHMLFTGNPGTGKTMIARIIGQILYDIGIIEENKVIEVEGKDLKGRYVGESGPKTAAKIDEAIGGVLFIDEAYAIGSDSFGKEVIATLIKSMEDRKDRFVVIFAGYPKEMQEFIKINAGIASRIGYRFNFEDYKVEELVKIFNVKMTKAGFSYDDKDAVLENVRKLCKVFSKKRDFGNGRFIDKVIQHTVIGRSSREYTTDTINVITASDIPDESKIQSTDVAEHKPYTEQLEKITGMENIKKKVEEFAEYVTFKKKVEEADPKAQIPDSNMHMIFTGNPGTGKTTIARIMVDLLYEVGVIKERKLLEVERKDLVAEYIGQTATKTGAVVERALNGVLFIDEAYSLTPKDSSNDFGFEAIATLIKAMEDNKGDLIVIFAGYRDEMRHFEKANPGIASRIGYRFEFDDYSCEELMAMFKNIVSSSGFAIDDTAMEKVKTVLDHFRRKENFGNGRFVSRLWQNTIIKHSQNYDDQNLMSLTGCDIPTIAEMNNSNIKKNNKLNLDDIVGLSEVKAQMQEFKIWVKYTMDAREKGLKIPSSSMHMVFTGNPGTGKTTVARIIAKMLYDMDIIMENKVVECDRSKLVSNHVGETALKTHEVIESAMGGVLFIDEAYMLAEEGTENNWGAEAVNTLMKVMEDRKDDFVVIFAGYRDEMKKFLEINPGIESRIGYVFHFKDYSGDELLQIFEKKLASYEYCLDESAKKKALRAFNYFCEVPNFGNGRFVDKFIRKTLMKRAKNYDNANIGSISEDIIPSIEEMAVVMGKHSSMPMPGGLSEEELERVAVHEMGHAIVHYALRPDIPIRMITLEANGSGSLGHVEYAPNIKTLNTKSEYMNEIAVILAGLEAEKLFYGECASGGTSDMRMAKEKAGIMVRELGMGDVSYGVTENDVMSSVEISSIIDQCRTKAVEVLEAQKNMIETLSKALISKHSMTGDEMVEIIKKP